jgi:hypothetical protein
MVAFQFYLQSGKQRKVGCVGGNNHVVYGQKFPGGNGSVRQCVVVMQQAVLLLPKISRSTHLREILYTDSQDMLVLSTTMHLSTTTAVQMEAQIPEIMHTSSCTVNMLSVSS